MGNPTPIARVNPLRQSQMPSGQPSSASGRNDWQQQQRKLFLCEYCNDQRVFRFDVPFGDPRFGRAYPCPKCNQDGVTARAGLVGSEMSLTLDAINTTDRPGAAAMLRAARIILDKRAGMVAFHGPYGNGKSTVLKALTATLVKQGIEARYITMTELMAYAREAFDSQQAGDSDLGRIKEWARVPVVMIDECDKARLSEHSREIQTYFFDVRYRQADTLATVAAWNGGRDAIGMPSVVSRFSEFGMFGLGIIHNADADMRVLLGEG